MGLIKVAVVGLAVGVAVYGITGVFSDEAKACDVDGDGQFYIEQDNGQIAKAQDWSLTETGQMCVTGGDSAPPIFVPRKDLVSDAGLIYKR